MPYGNGWLIHFLWLACQKITNDHSPIHFPTIQLLMSSPCCNRLVLLTNFLWVSPSLSAELSLPSSSARFGQVLIMLAGYRDLQAEPAPRMQRDLNILFLLGRVQRPEILMQMMSLHPDWFTPGQRKACLRSRAGSVCYSFSRPLARDEPLV